jgi:two-component system chemotaxis sensor kinase CheA
LALKGEFSADSTFSKAEINDEESMVFSEEISPEDIALLENFQSDLDSPSIDMSYEQKESRTQSFFPSENIKLEAQVASEKNVTKIAEKIVEKASETSEAKKVVPSKGIEDDSIRVSLARVEMLNNVVGELVIIQTVLNQHRNEVKNPLIHKSLSQLEKLSKEENVSDNILSGTFQLLQKEKNKSFSETSKTKNHTKNKKNTSSKNKPKSGIIEKILNSYKIL